MRINSIQNTNYNCPKFHGNNMQKKENIELANDAATCSVLLSIPFLLNSKANKKVTPTKIIGFGLLTFGIIAYITSIIQRARLNKN